MAKFRIALVCAVLTFGGFIFLSLNWHSHRPKFTYHSEIWADRAGYHVYLPATFDYGFDPTAFPAGIDTLTGDGFSLDSIPDRVVTKYTCGEALLRAPFYLLGKMLRSDHAPGGAGFTDIDHAMVDIAASFYASVGLLLLFLVLLRRWSGATALWSLIAILTGTNLLFYTIGETGMTHVYSFFLFSAFLFILDGSKLDEGSWRRGLAFGATTGLITLVRPTNVVFLPIAFLLTSETLQGSLLKLRSFVVPRTVLLGGLAFLLIWTPQLLYWNHTFGSPMVWSYGKEGFSNLLRPSFLPFWFAPYNGVFPYAPVLLVLLLAGISRFTSAPLLWGSTWSTFLSVSFLCSAWFVWSFGCGFGSRNLVEYGAVFAFPMASLLGSQGHYSKLMRGLVLLCCLYTLKLTFSCSNCWFGDTWNWKMYFNLLLGPFK